VRPRTAVLLVAAGAVGTVLVRRALRRSEERVDLYFDDGSMISLEGDSAEAQRLLPVARDLLSNVG
jgi:hypothetical protein